MYTLGYVAYCKCWNGTEERVMHDVNEKLTCLGLRNKISKGTLGGCNTTGKARANINKQDNTVCEEICDTLALLSW